MVFYDEKITLSLTRLVLSLRVFETLAAQQASALRIWCHFCRWSTGLHSRWAVTGDRAAAFLSTLQRGCLCAQGCVRSSTIKKNSAPQLKHHNWPISWSQILANSVRQLVGRLQEYMCISLRGCFQLLWKLKTGNCSGNIQTCHPDPFAIALLLTGKNRMPA